MERSCETCGTCQSFNISLVRPLSPEIAGQEIGFCSRWKIITKGHWDFSTAISYCTTEQIEQLCAGDCYVSKDSLENDGPIKKDPYECKLYPGEQLWHFIERIGGVRLKEDFRRCEVEDLFPD